ncbi:ABC transporter permease [Tianweitania sp. BSSL-BM11]|uniref:ABC transporter permease n=1 Tax=Tianweitania aestuarii TaxID=2814886 RepID=A0ABS5RWJ6_9HYPH|nr:ABC transporter permease [Tianweitania aestuarii]MBS9721450.1 ABC transporter permease [Tianweitania aestuarii]
MRAEPAVRGASSAPPLPRRRGPIAGASKLIISLVSCILIIAVWEGAVRFGFIQPLFLPAPSQIVNRAMLMLEQGTLFGHVIASTWRVMVGFVLASCVAIPLGIFLGTSALSRAIFDPVLSFLRPLPSMSWIPLSLLWFGIGESQKYSIVFMGSFAPSLLYVMEATKGVDPLLVKAAQNLGAKQKDVMLEVILPASLPQIISGLKVMLGIAWTCVISAELVAAREGLGFLIMNGKEYFQTDTVVLGMVLISLTVMATDIVFRALERRILKWKD